MPQQKDWQEERPEPLLELRSSPSDDAVETAARTAPDAKDPMGTNDDVQREA